ncbi:MAG: prolyl oligopeptidase family serine peptidase [Bryobacteraceae bacterium]|nr:prolyl oligopeptidase family serine peptidase [Bryobacteraceae bacterium]
MLLRSTAAGVLCAVLLPQNLPAQKRFALTIDNIMRGPVLVGYEPANPRWSGDGQRIYFQWKQASDPIAKPPDTYVVGRDGAGLRKLTEEEARQAPPQGGVYTRDRKRQIYSRDGDLFLYDYASDQLRRLTRTGDAESNPRFTQDEQKVAFTRGGNLYVLSLSDGFLEQMTDIRAAAAGAPLAGGGAARDPFRTAQQMLTESRDREEKGTDSQEFLKKEEQELLAIVKERAQIREENEARRKKENPRKPFTLQPRQSVAGLQLTPDGASVVALIAETDAKTKSTVVPNYVTEDGYTANLPTRNKVGDIQGKTRLAILSVETGEVKWVDHGQKLAPESEGKPPRDREVQMQMPVWSEDGSKAVLAARAADNKDRWILALDPASGKTRVLFADHDDAWLNGPGAQTLGWLKDNSGVYFQSERDGWSHLYTVSFDGGAPRQLTSGRFEVTDVDLSRDGRMFWITTSEASLHERHVYTIPVTGGAKTRYTTLPGRHAWTLSPDETWTANLYSFTTRPTELYAAEAKPNAAWKQLTSSPTPEWKEYNWTEGQMVEIPARDGVKVPAQFFKPANFRKGGPAVIFVHGAGYAQNVHRWWASYYREYMFHHFLVENGYAVLNIDYRASSGYGRDWRTAIYRHMGGKDLDDHVDGAKWLASQHGVDPKRIGIYGGSYGGFLTLMALFTQPDFFAAGAALRPVTDWAHYNHPYTANILNLPQTDTEAYRKSSPIYHAQGLKGALLIAHGMIDVNVHYQDSVRLVQRLIELGKENWEFASYPVEDHGFVQPSSWADEYKRIFKLFEQNLKGNR